MDALTYGAAGAQRFSRNSGRSLSGEAVGAIRYPSPFFDIAQTYLPTSFKTMLRWCRYYFLTNPLINAVCYKMAEYPVTDLVFDGDNDHDNNRWDRFFKETLHYKKFEIETGLDYCTYGNAFVSIHFPFTKNLICKNCKKIVPINRQKYVFREYKFVGQCQRCGHHGEFSVRDYYVKSPREIRLIRWNPEYISIQHNEATGENRYYYNIPPTLANDVRMAKRHTIENIPQVFIEALRKNKALLFSKQNIYHMQRPTIAQKDRGWGMPMILPVLKDVFYLQVLRKAQETIAIEHVVPMRILFPQAASGSADPYSTISMTQWRDKVEQELIRWRLDNNYIPLLPVPVGQQSLGGDGRALMLSQEYRQWSEHIVAGMGVPIEFVFGGMCNDINELAITSKGIVPLRDLVPEGEERTRIVDFQVANHEGVFSTVLGHNVGWKRPVRVRTRSGYTLRPAATHPLLTLQPDLSVAYKKVEELGVGDYVIRKVGSDLWSSTACELPKYSSPGANPKGGAARRSDLRFPAIMTGELARTLGYLVSEGSIDEERVRFSNSDRAVVKDYQACVARVFGLKKRFRKYVVDGKDNWAVEIWSRDLSAFFKSVGFWGGCRDMCIPWTVLRSKKEHVADFLRGYYEGDGGSCVKDVGGGAVRAVTTSGRLAKELQVVLQNAGVESSVYPPTKASPSFKIDIRGRSLKVFREFCGFVSKRKLGALNFLIEEFGHHSPSFPYIRELVAGLKAKHPQSSWSRKKLDLDIDPVMTLSIAQAAELLDRTDPGFLYEAISSKELVAERVGKFWKVSGKNLKKFCSEHGISERANVAWPRFYKKEVSLDALRQTDLTLVQKHAPEAMQTLTRLMEGDLRAEEIVEITPEDDLILMADLTVEGEHAYIAGGIVCHNSYSGSNVSMRILENHFLDVKSQRKQLITDFLLPNISAFLDWNPVTCHYKRFKMADDLQRSAFYMQLNQGGKLSDKSLLEDTDWDSNRERDRIEEERKLIQEGQRRQAIANANIQGEAQLVMAKYQMRGQKLMTEMTPEAAGQGMPAAEPMPGAGQPGMSPMAEGQMMNAQQSQAMTAGQTPGMEIPPAAPQQPGQEMAPTAPGMEGAQSQVGSSPAPVQGPGGLAMGNVTDLAMIAQKVVNWLNTMEDQERQHHLVKMQINNPHLYALVLPMLQQSAGSQQNSAAMPVPEQRPARRGPEAAMGA